MTHEEWEVQHAKYAALPEKIQDAIFYLSPYRDDFTQEWLSEKRQKTTLTRREYYAAILHEHNAK